MFFTIDKKKSLMLLFAILFSVLFKLIPHTPNFNPQLVLVLYVGTLFSTRFSMLNVLMLSVISDCVSAYIFGFSMLGSWVLFTYSAYLLMALAPRRLNVSVDRLGFIGLSLFSSLCFWFWTNFGSWLCSGMYPHSLDGFAQCYFLALPFLGSSLFAGIFWSSVLFGSVRAYAVWQEVFLRKGRYAE